MHLSQMFEAMEEGELTTAYVIGENPLRSEADTYRTRKLLEGLDCLVVQDIFLTDTAAAAHVVLPGTASWCEAEGTVTSSERRVQRVRKALDPPPGARDDIEIITSLAARLGTDWGNPTPEDLWNELRTLSPMHRGMSYEKLERLGGVQWPCPDDESEGTLFLHARLWETDPVKRGNPAPFHVVEQEDPLDAAHRRVPDPAHHRAPPGLLQHRRAEQPLQHADAAAGDAQPLAGGRGRTGLRRGRAGAGSPPAAARSPRRCTWTRPCARAWPS